MRSEFGQEDAHEAFRSVIDHLHDELCVETPGAVDPKRWAARTIRALDAEERERFREFRQRRRAEESKDDDGSGASDSSSGGELS